MDTNPNAVKVDDQRWRVGSILKLPGRASSRGPVLLAPTWSVNPTGTRCWRARSSTAASTSGSTQTDRCVRFVVTSCHRCRQRPTGPELAATRYVPRDRRQRRRQRGWHRCGIGPSAVSMQSNRSCLVLDDTLAPLVGVTRRWTCLDDGARDRHSVRLRGLDCPGNRIGHVETPAAHPRRDRRRTAWSAPRPCRKTESRGPSVGRTVVLARRAPDRARQEPSRLGCHLALGPPK